MHDYMQTGLIIAAALAMQPAVSWFFEGIHSYLSNCRHLKIARFLLWEWK